MPVFYKSSAQNVHRAEDLYSIIIETRPTEDPPPEDAAKSLITIGLLSLFFHPHGLFLSNSQINVLYMKKKNLVIITIPCRDLMEMQRAKEAVLYHLETLNPDFSARGNTLTVRVIPLDPSLFQPEEACDIIRQTLAQSLTFIRGWNCLLQPQETDI